MPIQGGSLDPLVTFDGTDGAMPLGTMILAGSTLYGMTEKGGANNDGTIFSMSTQGGGLTTLASFSGTDGALPGLGYLTLSGSTLYGMTSSGGANNDGAVFSIPLQGGSISTLLNFTGTNGSAPTGSLTLVGSTLYGMTSSGGANNKGTIFSMPLQGGTATTLLSFSGSNGASPYGSLTLVGSKLYGMTYSGGTKNDGTIFSIPVQGGPLATVLSFTGTSGAAPGANPYGTLTLSGSTLFGMTYAGGTFIDGGTVFAMNSDGTGFNVLQDFNSATGIPNTVPNVYDGSSPQGDVIVSPDGTTLYGMTEKGGTTGYGTVFSIAIPEPTACQLALLVAIAFILLRRRKLLILSQNFNSDPGA